MQLPELHIKRKNVRIVKTISVNLPVYSAVDGGLDGCNDNDVNHNVRDCIHNGNRCLDYGIRMLDLDAPCLPPT
jgi:hypothetical protein